MLSVSRIQITYGTTPGPQHGGNGGTENFFILEVEGRGGNRLDYAPMGASKSVSVYAYASVKYVQYQKIV